MPELQKILYPQKFNLILYYTITSFVVIAILTFAVGWIFSTHGRQALIKQSEEYTHYFIPHLNYMIYKRLFIAHYPGKTNKLIWKTIAYNLEKIGQNSQGKGIWVKDKKTVLIWLGKGVLFIARCPEHVGLTLDRSVDKKFGFSSAVRGIPASALYLEDSKGTFFNGNIVRLITLSMKWRMMALKKSQVGVMKIYQGYIMHEWTNNQVISEGDYYSRRVNGDLLFLVLFLMVLKAAKIINMRTETVDWYTKYLGATEGRRSVPLRFAGAYKVQSTQRK